MKKLSPVIAAFALASSVAAAQFAPPRPPRIDLVKLLSLEGERAEKVEAILDNAHERVMEVRRQIGRPTDEAAHATMQAAMQAIHTQTEDLLAQVLTADELARLHAALPRPPRPPVQ